MKIHKIPLTLILLVSLLISTFFVVHSVQPEPSHFIGTVKVNGQNVPEGTEVSAWIEGVQYASTTTTMDGDDSVYEIDVPGDDPETEGIIEGGTDGQTIIFKIDGVTATPTGIWEAGTSVEHDLSATVEELSVIIAGNGTGTVTSQPDGIDCGETCSYAFKQGETVILTATPSDGSSFKEWSGDCDGLTCQIFMTEAKSVTAIFDLAQNTLTVSKTGGGSGTVTSSPAGINCGETCAYDFNYNTIVTLTADAAAGSTFSGWSGACTDQTCQLKMDEDKLATAIFLLNQYNLTVNKTGSGTGTVTSAPAGINCGDVCEAEFDYGSVVTLTAAASAGSTFAGWSGADCSGTGDCAVEIDAAKSVIATFTSDLNILEVFKIGQGTVLSNPAGILCGETCAVPFEFNAIVILTAIPAQGWSFTGWSGDCTGMTCQVTMSESRLVTATFVADFRFDDVPDGYWVEDYIYRLHAAGITIGCSQVPPLYCPEDLVTRAEMAVFLLRALKPGHLPPQGTGTLFADVPITYWAVNWIEQLFMAGVTVGCASSPLRYCPDLPVTRAEMSAFLLRSKYGGNYVPPAATIAPFTDVPLTHWAVDWITQLVADEITTGVTPTHYDPEGFVTRAQMAAFLVRTFELP